MAYQYGAIQPNVSSGATEKERTEARRAFGLSKASYLSSMDQYYAGIEAAKETREDAQAHELEMFDKESPFKWEQLRLQEMGIETQRYGYDKSAEASMYGADRGAEASKYGVDKRAGTAGQRLGLDRDIFGEQTRQADIGNWFYDQEMGLQYGDDWESPAGGFGYEDLGGGDDYGSYMIDEWGEDISGGWNADWGTGSEYDYS